ncbi:NAD(P)(+) transhydrogenase (Re/Si-specific) subunit beta, partial [Desulfitispora alkaliphila]|uniref:NAD(P)(+) transhydrogenase (Re/Si-specific) subunit beta n=1 Tax=Desulfitispora alkaliphila TaxID=622674 RepID=UPI003D24537F
MSSPKSAVRGNRLGAISMFGAVIVTMLYNNIVTVELLYIGIIIGSAIGYYLAIKVAMIQIPQLVALFNGFGGGASLFVALTVFSNSSNAEAFNRFSGSLAIIVGGITLSGSLIAAAKLHQLIGSKPIVLKGHSAISVALLVIMGAITVATVLTTYSTAMVLFVMVSVVALVFGVIFTVRVGGADMPVTIALLNSCSGVASSLAGFVINDPLLVAIGAVVGAAGLILTQIMCKAMNRSLLQILTGKTSVSEKPKASESESNNTQRDALKVTEKPEKTIGNILKEAKKVIIIPGYGMALAQAQHKVKNLVDKLEEDG